MILLIAYQRLYQRKNKNIDYDFLNKKPKNPEDFFIDENENDTNTQEKPKKPGLYEKFLSMKIIKENRMHHIHSKDKHCFVIMLFQGDN